MHLISCRQANRSGGSVPGDAEGPAVETSCKYTCELKSRISLLNESNVISAEVAEYVNSVIDMLSSGSYEPQKLETLTTHLAMVKPGDCILVHKSAIYPTTKVTFDSLGLKPVCADFNDPDSIRTVLKENSDIHTALVQYTRQALEDSYDMGQVLAEIRSLRPEIRILTDDNYAVMKVSRIGVELGADLSAFSCFKLLGPEGVGVVAGRKELIERIEEMNYSGGSKVQGWQAMEVLRGLVYAPVALAIQAEVNEELVARLKNNSIPEVKDAFLANSQSKVLLVEFKEDIAKQVLAEAEKLGGLPNPVGAESKYETVPMFYRVSGTFRKADPTLENRMIRINPNRAGADTIIRILKESIERVKTCGCRSADAH